MARRIITQEEQKERLKRRLDSAVEALRAAEKRLSDLDAEREKLVAKIKERKVEVEKYQALTRESQYNVLDEMLRLKGVNIEDVTKAIANSDMDFLLELAALKAKDEDAGAGLGNGEAGDMPQGEILEGSEAERTALDAADKKAINEADRTTLDEAGKISLNDADKTILNDADRTVFNDADRALLDEAAKTVHSTSDLTAGSFSAVRLSAEKVSAEIRSADIFPAGKPSAEKPSSENSSSGKFTADGLTSENLATAKFSSENLAADGLTSENLATAKFSSENLAVRSAGPLRANVPMEQNQQLKKPYSAPTPPYRADMQPTPALNGQPVRDKGNAGRQPPQPLPPSFPQKTVMPSFPNPNMHLGSSDNFTAETEKRIGKILS